MNITNQNLKEQNQGYHKEALLSSAFSRSATPLSDVCGIACHYHSSIGAVSPAAPTIPTKQSFTESRATERLHYPSPTSLVGDALNPHTEDKCTVKELYDNTRSFLDRLKKERMERLGVDE